MDRVRIHAEYTCDYNLWKKAMDRRSIRAEGNYAFFSTMILSTQLELTIGGSFGNQKALFAEYNACPGPVIAIPMLDHLIIIEALLSTCQSNALHADMNYEVHFASVWKFE